MNDYRLSLREATLLRKAARAAVSKDTGRAAGPLDAFLTALPLTNRLATDAILPKGGTAKRFFARLKTETGEARFLRVTPPHIGKALLPPLRCHGRGTQGRGHPRRPP